MGTGLLTDNFFIGTLKEGVITLPSFPVADQDGNVSYTFQGIFAQGSSAYRTGIDSEFQLVLPEAVPAEARAKAHSNTMALKFMRRLGLLQTSWQNLRSADRRNLIDRRLQLSR